MNPRQRMVASPFHRALRSFVLFALLSGIPFASAAERIPAFVREHVAQRVENGYCVGLVVGVVDADGTSFVGKGRYSPGDDRPVGEDTIFEIGSITKAFTGVLLADMVERGLAAIDGPVSKSLPPGATVPARGGKQITLHDLTTHRSGLPRLPENFDPKDWDNPYADYSAARLLEGLSKHELSQDIGAKYAYSNLGAGLLGYALAQRAGKSYEQLIVERICDPLGMRDTRIMLSAEQRSRLAPGHAAGKPVKNWDLGALEGAGALRSTARDMLRLMSAGLGLAPSRVSKALDASHRERHETGQPELYVAWGWHVWTKHATTIIWHNGGTGGYHSFCGFRPDKKIGVVVLANSNEDIDDIGLHLLEPKFELAALRKTAAVLVAALDDYAGYYELAPGVVIHVTRNGEQLFAQITGQDKFPVFAESPTKFFYKVVDAH